MPDPDLRAQLRAALDAADPVTIDDLTAAARRRRTGRIAAIAVVLAAVVAAAIVVPLSLSSGPGPIRITEPVMGPPSTPTRGPGTSSATADGVTTTVTLLALSVVSGGSIPGRLVVDNRTGHPITAPDPTCPEDAFSVGITVGRNSTFPLLTGLECVQTFTFPAGTSAFSIALSTRYNASSFGSPSLVAGQYPATLQTRYGIPIPPPITVTVTAAPTGSTVPISTPPAGAPTVTVPSVGGLTQAQASARLLALGLTVAPTEAVSTTEPAGDIIGEDPAAGAVVAEGTHVIIYVSAGPSSVPSASTSTRP